MTEAKARIEGDAYYTPSWVIEQGLNQVLPYLVMPIKLMQSRVLDPGCGKGAFGQALAARWPGARVYGIDVNQAGLIECGPSYATIARGSFLTDPLIGGVDRYDLAIGNPPYNQAVPFIQQARKVADRVLFLLRLGFMGGQKRYELLYRDDPPAVVAVLSARPSFREDTDGTDRYDYCWAGWAKGQRGPGTVMMWLEPGTKEQRGKGRR